MNHRRSGEARRQRPDALDHRVDVLGRRAAATADDLGARLHEMSRVGRHVLGARHVHAAATDVARHAGVRLRAQLAPRRRRHLLDALENRLRADGAIESDDVRAPRVELARDDIRLGAVRRAPVGADRHLRDDRLLRVDSPRGEDRLLDLVEVGERLEDEEVDAAFGETFHLLPEDRASFVLARRPVRLEANAQRSDGAGDERAPIGGFARDGRGGPIQLSHLILQPVLHELDPVRAEAVRLDDVGAGLHVLRMNVTHELGRADVQLVVALVDEHALAVQHRPHRAVEDDDRFRVEEPFDRRVHREGAAPAPSARTA